MHFFNHQERKIFENPVKITAGIEITLLEIFFYYKNIIALYLY
jgi:hypothetical protein